MGVMISYSHTDRLFADELEAQLQSHGIKAWIDHQGIAQGAKWRDELLAQLRDCDSCIAIISKKYLASEHCRMELLIARSFGRRVIPIMIEDCWDDLSSFEATKGLDDLFILSADSLLSVGLPITKKELFHRVCQAAKGLKIEKKRHVYISFLEVDAPLATNISQALNKDGIASWIATTDTVAGTNWRSAQVRSMNNAACHFVLLNDGISKNEYVTTEVLMAEAIGIPVFFGFHPKIQGDEHRIRAINTELRNADISYRRIFDRNAFAINNDEPYASADMIEGLTFITRSRSNWFGIGR